MLRLDGTVHRSTKGATPSRSGARRGRPGTSATACRGRRPRRRAGSRSTTAAQSTATGSTSRQAPAARCWRARLRVGGRSGSRLLVPLLGAVAGRGRAGRSRGRSAAPAAGLVGVLGRGGRRPSLVERVDLWAHAPASPAWPALVAACSASSTATGRGWRRSVPARCSALGGARCGPRHCCSAAASPSALSSSLASRPRPVARGGAASPAAAGVAVRWLANAALERDRSASSGRRPSGVATGPGPVARGTGRAAAVAAVDCSGGRRTASRRRRSSLGRRDRGRGRCSRRRRDAPTTAAALARGRRGRYLACGSSWRRTIRPRPPRRRLPLARRAVLARRRALAIRWLARGRSAARRGAVLRTQYADGGAFQWGGRFLLAAARCSLAVGRASGRSGVDAPTVRARRARSASSRRVLLPGVRGSRRSRVRDRARRRAGSTSVVAVDQP